MNKLPWYEYINQNQFEDMVFDALKEKYYIGTRKAVQRYLEMCSTIKTNDERCKIDSNTYSLRKFIVERLEEQGINLE